MKFSLYGPKLKAGIDAIRQWPRRQRFLLLLAVVLSLLVLLYSGVVAPLLALNERWEQELRRRQQLLRQYQGLVANQQVIRERLNTLRQAVARAEGQLLSGGSPAVAAADLQELLKKLAQDQGIQVGSMKVLPPREQKNYLEIPLALQLTARVDQLLGFLHQVESNAKMLLVTDAEILAPQRETKPGEAPQLRVNLVVTGLMKKGTGI